MSLTYNENNSEQSTDPCGTPQDINSRLEIVLLIQVY